MGGKILWIPSKRRIESTNMFNFMQLVNKMYNKNFNVYNELYQWSIENIENFWELMWEAVPIIASKKYSYVVDDLKKMPGAHWFNGAELNLAENLLRFRDDQPALLFKGEKIESVVHITYSELYEKVSRLAHSLRREGVKAGDKVVGFMPNIPGTIVAMLATASIGAIWSSCSPDFGIKSVMDRFSQIEPAILFTTDGYFYNGKKFNSLGKIIEIFHSLSSKPKIIVEPYTEEKPDISEVPNAVLLEDFLSNERGGKIEFEQLPFNHPLYIMYSSGTTGLPKCIVQSAGGILLNHLKELKLHCDLKREDRIFYFTTTGWMMWNWLVSSLALGATIVLYDGSPFYPDSGSLFRLAEEEGVTIFGTSPKFLDSIKSDGLKPGKNYYLGCIKTILTSGSPLSEDNFDYVYREIKRDVCLSSISGGTDINGCFAAGNPMGPVYSGELQCRCLAMDIRAFDELGNTHLNKQGELVCLSPSPSMPIYFLNDPGGEKYHKAYFDAYPGIWRHGDFIEINEHGGVIIYGRSDATLNPGGVRIGTADIYSVVEAFPEVEDSIVVGQDWEGDERVILFVKMTPGECITDEFIKKIRTEIRNNCSPRHVPSKVIEVEDIPYTINMKKVEIAVKKIIHGQDVLNLDALRNPGALDLYRDIAELKK